MARPVTPQGTLDDIDRAIIEALQADGRMPYTRLGQVVGLSEAAVRQRVQRLLDAGVIQIAAITNPLQLGKRRMAMIGICADGDLVELAEQVSKMPEVEYVVVTAGSFDLLLEVLVDDDDELLRLLNEKVRTLPGVRRAETFIYLRLHKQTFTYGAR